MKIRHETEGDHNAVRSLNDLAFQGPVEGSIVDNIRSSCDDMISLVAVEDDQVIGHIFFSPVLAMSGEN